MMNQLSLLVVFSYISLNFCVPSCDEYQRVNRTDEESSKTIFTVSNYWIPSDQFTRLQQNVSCSCSSKQFCLRKCCFENSVVNEGGICSPSTSNNSFDYNQIPNLPTENFKFVYGSGSNCNNLPYKITSDLKFFQNGSVSMENEFADIDEYCMDYLEDQGNIGIMRCTTDEASTSEFKWYFWISDFFLLLTFIVYISTEELNDNMAGKILLGQVGTLLASHVLEGTQQALLEKIVGGPLCMATAFLQQFLGQASFTWLNVMCFDISSKIKSNEKDCSEDEDDNRKLKKYSLYAFGGPLSIVAVSALIEYVPAMSYIIPKPPITDSCQYAKNLTGAIYNDTSIVATLFSNLWMFTKSALTLKRCKQGSKVEEDRNEQLGSELSLMTQFCMFIKLFVIMGVVWLLKIVVSFVPGLESYEPLMIYVNSLEGVLIFLVFVCNRRVLFLLNKKFYPNHIIFNDKNTVKSENHSCSAVYTSSCCFILTKRSEEDKSGQHEIDQENRLKE